MMALPSLRRFQRRKLPDLPSGCHDSRLPGRTGWATQTTASSYRQRKGGLMPRFVIRLGGMLLAIAAATGSGRASAFTFSAPVAVDDARPASEPGIAADSADNIYID